VADTGRVTECARSDMGQLISRFEGRSSRRGNVRKCSYPLSCVCIGRQFLIGSLVQRSGCHVGQWFSAWDARTRWDTRRHFTARFRVSHWGTQFLSLSLI
jgi:hypothetical protein